MFTDKSFQMFDMESLEYEFREGEIEISMIKYDK